MRTYDETSAFGPGPKMKQSQMVDQHLKKDLKTSEKVKAIFCEADIMIDLYKDVLTDSEVCMAKRLCWGRSDVDDYRRNFFANVLLNSSLSIEQLKERRAAIRCNNPEWAESFLREIKRRRAKMKRLL